MVRPAGKSLSAVIASEAKQSNQGSIGRSTPLDCFVAPLLAMTVNAGS